MANIVDYVKLYYNSAKNEIGFRIGTPIIRHEIGKIPLPEDDKKRFYTLKYDSLALKSIGNGVITLTLGLTVHTAIGDISGTADISSSFGVSDDHKIIASIPRVSNLDIETNKFFRLLDILDLINDVIYDILGIQESDDLSIFYSILRIVTFLYNLEAILTAPVIVSPEIKEEYKAIHPFISKLGQIKNTHVDVYLSSITLEPEGIGFMFKYSESTASLIAKLAQQYHGYVRDGREDPYAEINAAFHGLDGNEYFFRDRRYICYDPDHNSVLFNRKIIDDFPGIQTNKRIDAAFQRLDDSGDRKGKVYIFQGEKYYRYTKSVDELRPQGWELDDDYPRFIKDEWNGLWDGKKN